LGDSIWNNDVSEAIQQYQPDYIITNSGGAVIPAFESAPILMDEAGTIAVIKAAPKAKVIAVHIEALDHCRTTRASLQEKAEGVGIGKERLAIPKVEAQVDLVSHHLTSPSHTQHTL